MSDFFENKRIVREVHEVTHLEKVIAYQYSVNLIGEFENKSILRTINPYEHETKEG